MSKKVQHHLATYLLVCFSLFGCGKPERQSKIKIPKKPGIKNIDLGNVTRIETPPTAPNNNNNAPIIGEGQKQNNKQTVGDDAQKAQYSKQNFSVKNWKQTNKCKDKVQEITIDFDLYVGALQEDNNWVFPYFDPAQQIGIKAWANNEAVEASIDNGWLAINFKTLLKENDVNNVKIQYEFTHSLFTHSTDFIKGFFVFVPIWEKNTEVDLNVEIPENFIIYSDLKHLEQQGKNLVFKGILKDTEINEEVLMCIKEAVWDVDTIAILSTTQPAPEDFNISINNLYDGGNNKVENFSVTCDGQRIEYDKKDGNIVVNWKKGLDKYEYHFKAQIRNNCQPYQLSGEVKENWDNYKDTLKPIAEAFISQYDSANVGNNDPVYVKIAHGVKKHLEYDSEMANKKLSPIEIYNGKKGICAHYATLFKYLMLSLGVPCHVVLGDMYDPNKNDFTYHSWNVVKVNGQWIPLDVLNEIWSGILPTSYIFHQIDHYELQHQKVIGNCQGTEIDFENSCTTEARFIGS